MAKNKFNSGAKPLIMAYIGQDDPLRGDSKARVGIARRVAELLDGEYVYVDEQTLEDCFPNIPDYAIRLRRFLDQHGEPDILVGALSAEAPDVLKSPPALAFDSAAINLPLAMRSEAHSSFLVSHDLTDEQLEEEASTFQKEYGSQIKGPLVAIMMAGDVYDIPRTTGKLAAIARSYDEITFFVCPSRRTEEGSYQSMMHMMAAKCPDHAVLIGQNYRTCLTDYNPYMGLLGASNHFIVMGDSNSMVSEALFTGKSVAVVNAALEQHPLMQEGYFQILHNMDDTPFPTPTYQRVDVTEDVAQNIVAEYLSAPTVES